MQHRYRARETIWSRLPYQERSRIAQATREIGAGLKEMMLPPSLKTNSKELKPLKIGRNHPKPKPKGKGPSSNPTSNHPFSGVVNSLWVSGRIFSTCGLQSIKSKPSVDSICALFLPTAWLRKVFLFKLVDEQKFTQSSALLVAFCENAPHFSIVQQILTFWFGDPWTDNLEGVKCSTWRVYHLGTPQLAATQLKRNRPGMSVLFSNGVGIWLSWSRISSSNYSDH